MNIRCINMWLFYIKIAFKNDHTNARNNKKCNYLFLWGYGLRKNTVLCKNYCDKNRSSCVGCAFTIN